VPIHDPVFSKAERAFLDGARSAILVTVAADGRPRPVPICFVLDPARPVLYTPLDEKPKTVDDPRQLARMRDIEADPRVAVLVERWDEDWANLAWLRCTGVASMIEAEASTADHTAAIAALREKYPQYSAHDLEVRPIIRVTIERTTSWGTLELD
jgi:PPOX class probable F420-dependent enzyme